MYITNRFLIFCLFFLGNFNLIQGSNKTLRILSWGGLYQKAQREAFFKPYMEKTGFYIEESCHSSLQNPHTVLNSPYDIIQVEAPNLLYGCKQGYFEKINWSKLGSRFQYVPGAAEVCGIGAITWSMVFAYHKDVLRSLKGQGEWKDFFDFSHFPGKRALRRTPYLTLEIALLADDVLPSQVYPLLETSFGLKRAFDKLSSLFHLIQWWEQGDDPLLWLEQGIVQMASVYNGRIQHYRKYHPQSPLTFSWRQQIVTMDYWVISKNSPYTNQAYTFLQIATNPHNLKELIQKIPYGPVHRNTFQFLKPSENFHLLTSPLNKEKTFIANAKFWLKNGIRLTKSFNEWFLKHSKAH